MIFRPISRWTFLTVLVAALGGLTILVSLRLRSDHLTIQHQVSAYPSSRPDQWFGFCNIPPKPVSGHRAAVTGRAIYDNGSPARDVTVKAKMLTWDREDWSRFQSRAANLLSKTATTGPDGTYRISDLLPAPYIISTSGTVSAWSATASRLLTVQPGKNVRVPDIVLTQGAFIHGQVVDAATGQPLQGLYIGCGGPRVVGPHMPIWGAMPITDREGRFSLQPPPGKCCLYLGGISSTIKVNLQYMKLSLSHRDLDIVRAGGAMYAMSGWAQVSLDHGRPFYQQMGPANDPIVVETAPGQTRDIVFRLRKLAILPGNKVIIGTKPE